MDRARKHELPQNQVGLWVGLEKACESWRISDFYLLLVETANSRNYVCARRLCDQKEKKVKLNYSVA